MKEEKIKVLALLPMELPKEIELDNTLEAMQKFVGGLIECITFSAARFITVSSVAQLTLGIALTISEISTSSAKSLFLR